MALLNAAQSIFDMRSAGQPTSAPEGTDLAASTFATNARPAPIEKPKSPKRATRKHQQIIKEVTTMLLAIPRLSKHGSPSPEYALHSRSSLEREIELACCGCGTSRSETGSAARMRQVLKLGPAYIQISKIRAEYADRIPFDSGLMPSILEARADLKKALTSECARTDAGRSNCRITRYGRLLDFLNSIATELGQAVSAPAPSALQSDTPPGTTVFPSMTESYPAINSDDENASVPRNESALSVDIANTRTAPVPPPTSTIPIPISTFRTPTSTQPTKSDADEPRAWLRVLLPHVLIRQTNANGQLHDEVLAFHSSLQDLLSGLLKIKFGDTLAVAACMEDLPDLLSVSMPGAARLDLPSATSATYWATLSRNELYAQYKAAGDELGHELRKWGDSFYAKYFISARMTTMPYDRFQTLAKDVRHIYGPGLQKDARFDDLFTSLEKTLAGRLEGLTRYGGDPDEDMGNPGHRKFYQMLLKVRKSLLRE